MRPSKIQASTKMDPKIWSRLPEDLLDRVLSFLSLKNFLKITSTCKHFKALLYSPAFISKHLSSSSSSSSSSSHPTLSFLLLSHTQFHPVYPLFDTLLNNWRSLSLSPSHVRPSSASELLSSSNGLVCFSHPNSSSFVICNLLTRSSRIVKFPTLPFQFELLTLVSTSKGGYKLFMLSCFGPSRKALIFDSKIQSWNQFEGLNLFFSENYNQEGVFFKGFLYFITSEPFVIMCFDMDNGYWKRSENGLPNGLAFARLCSDGRGKLFLIGGLGSSGISRNMKLWALNEEGGGWREIETVPELMCKKFLSVSYHNYEHVYCFWHQGLICLCCYNWPEVLYYKVSRKTWHWVPKCPSLPDKWSCGFRWFSFVPELYSVA